MPEMPIQKPGASRQDYVTPWEFIFAAQKRIGIAAFAFDVAASRENTRVPDGFYTIEYDALRQEWPRGIGWNWCNHPFAKNGAFTRKAYEEGLKGANTAVLLPASLGANWWRDYVHEKARVLGVNGRITFVGEFDPYPKDCALLLYGPDASRVSSKHYDIWTWERDIPRG